MLISGVQSFTLLDYPDKTACIVFIPGCNFRCGYCHNPEFVLPECIKQLQGGFVTEEALFNFLFHRRDLLDGVVISGGEPTIAPDLIPFMQKIRRMGFTIKLDTNGNRPDVIERAIQEHAVDYVAMDLKASLDGYRQLVGPLVQPENIAKSVALLKKSPIDYEFRTTLLEEVHDDIMLDEMATLIEGARHWYLQRFRPNHTLDPAFANCHAFDEQKIANVADRYREKIESISIR